jgi:hypothetical protein
MGRFIVEIRNPEDDADRRLLEWSTIVDAPVTYGMDEAEFTTYYRSEYGNDGMREFPSRMARVREKGTSAYDDDSWESTALVCNRAGPDETRADAAMLWKRYVTDRQPT